MTPSRLADSKSAKSLNRLQQMDFKIVRYFRLKMKDKFDAALAKFMENKKQILIPKAEQFDEMVSLIRDSADKNKKSQQEMNLIKRYSIRVENSETNLYHSGDKSKETPQKVLKQEDLFNLLKERHVALGHAGRDIMWKDMRDYYGISKSVI